MEMRSQIEPVFENRPRCGNDRRSDAALLDLLINFMAENKRKDNMDYYTFLFYRLNEKLPISEAEERE